jgi:5-methylcytosine-specific restriction endonuclease McrA
MGKTWIKLYTEILADPKMGMLTDAEHRTCMTCFLMAGQQDADGLIGTEEEIAWQLRRPVSDDLMVLHELGILTEQEGQWGAVNFSKMRSCECSVERHQWQAIRRRIATTVFEAHGRICPICGSETDLTIDHIRPLARGGTSDPENLHVLCRRCNSRKGARWEE